MKFKKVLLGAALFVSASVVNAATVSYPTDGDINVVSEAVELGGYTLAIFDEVADMGGMDTREVSPLEVIHRVGVNTLSADHANTLTINSDFEWAATCPSCGAWTGGDGDRGSSQMSPERNTVAAGFADIAVYELVGDILPVPVPAAAWLFASGLLGLVGVARRCA